MARITVEDCVRIIPNRFELCLVASNRAKAILSGAPTTLDKKEKSSVIALREIAEGLVEVPVVKENILRSIKNRGAVDVLSSDEQIADSMNEEAESYLNLKDTTFVDENIQVDD